MKKIKNILALIAVVITSIIGLSEKSVEAQSNNITYSKKIDAFRDNEKNPDTNLFDLAKDRTDLYRIYLDAAIKEEKTPIDFLIVIDRSSSMGIDDIYFEGDTVLYRRDRAVTNVLNGDIGHYNENGIISKIINANEKNQYAVIGFAGDTRFNPGKNHYFSPYDYKNDTNIIRDWSSKKLYVQATNIDRSGTNYEAGLKSAEDMFEKVKGNGHRKIMIFLSDGVPTYFIMDREDLDRKEEIKNNGISSEMNDFSEKDLGLRWGTGTTSKENYPFCILPSKIAFDNFIKKFPDVEAYTIHVAGNLIGDGNNLESNTEILKYYAEKGKGKFFPVRDGKALQDAIEDIVSEGDVKDLVISDVLSDKVDFHKTNPDIKVIARKGSEKIILWENGRKTKEGEKLIDKVVINGKEIKLVFIKDAQFDQNTRYELSFNVSTTQKAYDDYIKNGYGEEVGDTDTDFGSNKTSSKKPGFFSNEKSTLSYTDNGKTVIKDYQKPVIQVIVDLIDIDAKKIWTDQGKESFRPESVKFRLLRKQSTEENFTQVGEDVLLNKEGGWSYTWNNMVEKARDVLFEYKVEEIYEGDDYVKSGYVVDGPIYEGGKKKYIISIENTIVKNTNISVEKKWNISDSSTSKPKEVTILLEANRNGKWEKVDIKNNPVVLSDENNWRNIWENLKDGCEYRVTEINPPKGYETSIEKTVDKNNISFVVTNTEIQEIEELPSTGARISGNLINLISFVCVLGAGILYKK